MPKVLGEKHRRVYAAAVALSRECPDGFTVEQLAVRLEVLPGAAARCLEWLKQTGDFYVLAAGKQG